MMRSDNNEPSKVYYAMETFGNIFLLNVLFILFSLPIVTIGASLTALYSVMMKIVRKEEGGVFEGFKRAFFENFKQATLTWLSLIVVCIVMYAEYLLVSTSTGVIASIYLIILVIELILISLTLPFLFPLIARFDNTFFKTIQNAFLLSVSNIGSCLKIFLAWFMPIFIMFRYPDIFYMLWYLWILIAFGLIAFGSSFTIRKVFDRIARVQEENEKKENEKKTKKNRIEKKSISEHLAAFDKDK